MMSGVLYYLSNVDYNNYDIVHPEKKHHAIIQIKIERKMNSKIAYNNCTAFVISDTQAITAGHCVGITQSFIETQHKNILKESYDDEKKINDEIAKIAPQCFDPRCSFYLQQLQYSLSLLKVTRERFLKLRVDEFSVFNSRGEDTGIKAIAKFKRVAKDNKDRNRDHALLKGDFSNFEKLPIRIGFGVKPNDKLKSCGYAEGNYPPICIDFVPVRNSHFLYEGVGYMARGMSGGPVIDKYGIVVGINSRVGLNSVYIDPLIGILNFKQDRKKKTK